MFYEQLTQGYFGYAWPDIQGFSVIVASIMSNPDVDTYEILIRRQFYKPEDMIEAAKFMDENASGDWLVGQDVSGFASDDDAFLFKMTWV